MGFQEGKGFVIPYPRQLYVNKEEMITTCSVADDMARAKGYDKTNCIVGLSAEAAISSEILNRFGITRVAQWHKYNDRGDGGIDLIVYNTTYQVKCLYRGKDLSITRYYKNRDIPLRADYYIFTRMKSFAYKSYAALLFLGFIDKKELEQYATFKTRNGRSFLNIEPKYLRTFDEFLVTIDNAKLTK